MKELLVTVRKRENISRFADSYADGFIMADRQFSSSADCNDLRECVRQAHSFNRKLYVRCDRLYQQQELPELKEFLKMLDDIKADGIIYSDIGVFKLMGELGISCQGIYAPETLLTNYYDIEDIKNDGVDGCVISKDIPLQDVYDIAERCPDYCFVRIHGPILIAYSRRRYIASYLQNEEEHTEGYFLQEETRDTLLPLVEKKEGSWLYGTVLQSLSVFNELLQKPFRGFIIDNICDDDQQTLRILELYKEAALGKRRGALALEKLLSENNDKEYTAIEDVRKTWLDKEQA
jgi:putative protease